VKDAAVNYDVGQRQHRVEMAGNTCGICVSYKSWYFFFFTWLRQKLFPPSLLYVSLQ